MIIRSKTIRLAMFISAFVIAAIVVFQLIWLRKVYSYEQKQFDHGIARAVRGFYEDIDQPLNQYYNLNQLIENISPEIFTVRISNVSSLQNDSLAFYMQSELEDEDIFTDCYFGIFSGGKKEYVYT
jgi:two-component system, OmpR family, phosphate regulon sensor histidine kinase PhoR